MGAIRLGDDTPGSWGEVISAAAVHLPVIDDPMVVELLDREAILWCLQKGFSVVRFGGMRKWLSIGSIKLMCMTVERVPSSMRSCGAWRSMWGLVFDS
ncbi:unnamed protein product [Linum trigynum]|uniref:Uncharacterized protein n=1 Tax=Linum trigynum TaxID=586398 RepID=A0AAV2EX79_9ROSI